MLDRIDIHVEAPAVEYRDLSSDERAEPSTAIRERVLGARKRQQERFSGETKCRSNAEMSHSQLKVAANWTPRARNSCEGRWRSSI